MNFVPRALTLALATVSLWWSPLRAAAAQGGTHRSLLSQLYGDLAFEVRTRGQGSMTVGAADARSSVVILLMAADLRRWADSATRMLAARPRRGNIVKWDASVTGPGVTAGSMSLSRSITPSDTTLVLLVTDTAFHAVRTNLTMDDAKALTGAMKRAANAAMPTKPTPPPKATAPPRATTPSAKKPPEHPRTGSNVRRAAQMRGGSHTPYPGRRTLDATR